MALHGLFRGLEVYFGFVFVFSGCFRSVIVLPWICTFFYVVIPFFASLRGEIVLFFSLLFCCCGFGLTVLLFLCFISCAFLML